MDRCSHNGWLSSYYCDRFTHGISGCDIHEILHSDSDWKLPADNYRDRSHCSGELCDIRWVQHSEPH